MAARKKNEGINQRWARTVETLSELFPNLSTVFAEESDFIELRLKARDDATTLAVLKRYGHDGRPMVCFGVGYGVVAAFMAVDATVEADNWRPDKPWKPAEK